VKDLAYGLLAFGFEAGDKLLIIGDNAPQWYYAEMAAQANRGLAVGLYSELLPEEVKSVAEN
jgi:long-chain acyl-CoA synthetase